MQRFVTTSRGSDGHLYGGHVDAIDIDHAQQLCDERGLGETVEGVLYLQFAAEHCTPKRANEITRALADSYIDEPPDASEFC